ncbi:MAG: radical SAM protein [Nitrospirota bacterium]
MRYYLSDRFVLKRLETFAVYDMVNDELYELDEEAFAFLQCCAAHDGCSGAGVEKDFIGFCLSEGILTTEAVSAERPPFGAAPVPSLRYLELQITDRCNLSCRHCYLGTARDNELSIESIAAILDEFEEMQGLRLLITGGEPLMHRRFAALNELLPRYRFRKILFTNGLMLHDEILETLNVQEVQFSVDGLERGHDALRGRGTYKRVMERVKRVLNAGIAVSIATMVHRENLGEFDAMEVLFKEMGIREWTVDVPCAAGNLLCNPLLQVSPERAGRYLRYGFGSGLHGGGDGYACGHHLMSVLADGRISKCAFYATAPIGTIREGLRTSWTRMKPVRIDDLECAALDCEVMHLCRGGCRFRAGTGTEGNEISLKRDIYRCYAYDIMK